MTREVARAAQSGPPPKPARIVRATVTAIGAHTVDVQFPGSLGSVPGVRAAGAVYTIGGDAWVWVQEPAVGPVIPIA